MLKRDVACCRRRQRAEALEAQLAAAEQKLADLQVLPWHRASPATHMCDWSSTAASSCCMQTNVRGFLSSRTHRVASWSFAYMQGAAREVAALEERYWHAANDLGLQLAAHLQERDATLAKASLSCCAVNTYSDFGAGCHLHFGFVPLHARAAPAMLRHHLVSA